MKIRLHAEKETYSFKIEVKWKLNFTIFLNINQFLWFPQNMGEVGQTMRFWSAVGYRVKSIWNIVNGFWILIALIKLGFADMFVDLLAVLWLTDSPSMPCACNIQSVSLIWWILGCLLFTQLTLGRNLLIRFENYFGSIGSIYMSIFTWIFLNCSSVFY